MARPHEFTGKVRLAAWTRCRGACEACGQKIVGVAEFDHVLPIALGGESTVENCAVNCAKCHRAKTVKDVRQIRKADRQGRAAIKRSSRPMPGGKRSRWRKKIDGTVEAR